MAPVFALYGTWIAARHGAALIPAFVRAAAAPSLGIAAYFAVRLALDVPLFPEGGRYAPAGWTVILRNAAVVVAGVAPWAAAAWLGTSRGTRRGAAMDSGVMIASAVTAVLPSLMLSWQSPNFWYAATPVAALGVTSALRHAARPGRARAAVAGLALASLVACVAVSWRTGAYRWGPYSESSVAQWRSLPRQGGRVIWFDLDSRESYGGLARTIGPGDRLAHALRLASGDPAIEAIACISVLVGPSCESRAGDELYLHSRGRVTRVFDPPAGTWYVMP